MPRKSRLKHTDGALVRRTRELLKACETPHLEIYKATGIPPHWLWVFCADRVPDPSVNRVECLFLYLGGRWADL